MLAKVENGSPKRRGFLPYLQTIKKWRRSKKIALIKSINPKWQDLSAEWYDEGT
jgi:hypothetical protein